METFIAVMDTIVAWVDNTLLHPKLLTGYVVGYFMARWEAKDK